VSRDSNEVKKVLDDTVIRWKGFRGILGPDYAVVWDLPDGTWGFETFYSFPNSPVPYWVPEGTSSDTRMNAEIWERTADDGWVKRE
jgi:hypothetical protein